MTNIQEIDLKRPDFEATHPFARLFNFDHEKLVYFGDRSDDVKRLNELWSTWCACIGLVHLDLEAAKANAVPEWVDYEKQCPKCDGDYLIYVCDEIHVATYLSKFGFVGVDNGCAYIQDLISHWSNRPQPPKAQEPSHDSKHPNIYRAAKEIWYDNGMINRLEPIEEKIEQLSAWLKTLDADDLAEYNEKLNLTDDDLSEVCCGEETLAYSILSDETVHEFLGQIFNEEYAPKAQEPSHD